MDQSLRANSGPSRLIMQSAYPKNAVGRLPYRVALWSDAQIAPSPTAALIQFSATFLRVPVPQNAACFQGIWTGLT